MVEGQADNLLNEKITKLKREREEMQKEMEEKKKSEEDSIKRVRQEIERLLTSRSSMPGGASKKDIVSNFTKKKVFCNFLLVISRLRNLVYKLRKRNELDRSAVLTDRN